MLFPKKTLFSCPFPAAWSPEYPSIPEYPSLPGEGAARSGSTSISSARQSQTDLYP